MPSFHPEKDPRFADGRDPAVASSSGRAWKVLIVDDDEGIHQVTRMALSDLQAQGWNTEFLSARTSKQAKSILQDTPDIAVLLLDMVLETPDAGLRLIEHIQQKMGNTRIRIILRTGYPDRAPERSVMEKYDIDAYLAKTDLTADRLYTTVLRALRAFSSFEAQQSNRDAMSRVMVATSGLFELRSTHHFYFNCLLQLNGLLALGHDALFCVRGDNVPADELIRIRAGSGRFASLRNVDLSTLNEPEIVKTIRQVFDRGNTLHTAKHFAFLLRARPDVTAVAFIEGSRDLQPLEWQMLEIFRSKAATAFNSLLLVDELNAAQKATVLALARVAEYKDNVAPGHLQRIERLTSETTREMYRRGAYPDEVDEVLVDRIGLACILHDVGMIAVPDQVMFSTEQLEADDYKVIHRHPMAGWEILQNASAPLRGQSVLSIAAEICRTHHERFDGTGYPAGLGGQDIPIAGRIVSVVDVFDALITDRSHRHAWTPKEALQWISEQAGKHFDPLVVEAFLAVIGRILEAEPDWIPMPPSRGLASAVGQGLRGLVGRLSRNG